MKAWLFQDHRQKEKLGDKAPWSVGWLDPEGKRRSKKVGAKSLAERYLRRVEGELAAGTYQKNSRKQWADFRAEYKERIAARLSPGTLQETMSALDHFEKLVKPKRIMAITTQTVDEFIVKRQAERGRNKESKVSPATVNKELRHLRAVLAVAVEWGYLPSPPKYRKVREPEKLPTYVTAGHFKAIYEACDSATKPVGLPYSAGDWWRALIVFAYMTGWRIGEPLSLRKDDLDLEKGTAITRAADNKGKRDELVPLHPVVVDHLKAIPSFGPLVFPWPHHRTTLWVEFSRIQKSAGIHLDCAADHEHTDRCHVYGFHDFRRAFATANVDTLTADALQKLMRHRSYSTTQRYINMAGKLSQAVATLHVPEVLKAKSG